MVNQMLRIPSGCVLWLDLTEDAGNVVYDRSGHGNNGKVYGAMYVKSPPSPGRLFDGIDDYIDCGNDESLDITDAITIGAWFNARKWRRYNHIIAKQGGAPDNSYLMEQDSTYPRIHAGVWDGSAWHLATSGDLKTNTWYYGVMTFDGSYVKLYINGNLVDSVAYSGTIHSTPDQPVIIGKFPPDGNYWDGLIALVHIFNRPLSPSEIKYLYEETQKLIMRRIVPSDIRMR